MNDVVTIVDDLLTKAVRAGASDVHFEPLAAAMAVKFRLDGLLTQVEVLPKPLAENVIARLKVLSGLLTYRNDVPQEGHLRLVGDADGEVIDKRVAIFPTIHGQRAVVRLFYSQHSLDRLDALGLSPAMLASLKRLCRSNQGLLLLTGPAGSGKSTTLAALLREVLEATPGKSIVALEDPVERPIEGVTQVQITPHGPMTFATALRSLLRQDPQVLMIGEIRDEHTARIAVEASLTGHLLMSTMHSGTPAGALLRLLEMGIEPYQVTSSVLAVLNQRLLRRLCPACKQPDGGTGQFRHVGCPECMGTGYKGRTLVADLVEVDSEVRRAILAKADMEQLQEVLQGQGHLHLESDGQRLVAQGVTTREEVELVCGSPQTAAPRKD